MKVLSYIDSLNRGGAETLIMDIAKNITKEDFEYIIVSGKGGDLEEEIRNSNAKYIRLNRRKPVDIKLIKQLREIIRTEEIDIIHSHNDVSSFYGYISSRGLNIKRINSIHGNLNGKYDKTIYRYLIKKSDCIITVSKSFSDYLSERNKINKALVLYNGIDEKKFIKQNSHKVLINLNISDKDFVVGMVGNFSNGKDYWTFCQAIPIVLEKKNKIKFIMVGDITGPNNKNYIKCYKFCQDNHLSENVYFLGKRNDIPEILNFLNIFVLSSNTDTFGIAVIEAMFSKVPCLLSDIPSLKEISENGRYAKLFIKGDYNDLASLILKCLENPNEMKSLAESAYHKAVKNFSINTHIQKLSKIYRELLEIK